MIAWVTIVFRGYLPEGINNVLTFVNGFYARLYGYIAFLTDDYPPIGRGGEGRRPRPRRPPSSRRHRPPAV